MTKVLPSRRALRLLLPLAACFGAAITAFAQNAPEKPAEALYLQLGQVGLDPAQVYQVRGASLNRSSIQLSFEDGTIAFTKDVMGRITGAFFAGDGEILLPPPNEAERQSMSLFTGMAILEERFATAYLRFNDDVANELAPDLRATSENKQEFLDHWGSTAKNLAGLDATRLLLTFSQMLPEPGRSASDGARVPAASDRFLHARLQGDKLGVFDVYFDSAAGEQILAGQSKGAENGETYYDVWTSFSPIQVKARESQHATQQPQSEEVQESRIALRHFTIATDVLPPKKIHARARVECEVQQGGARTLLFELSRFLEVETVTLDGRAVEFIHNPALEGTQISRRGNDTLAVVLPETARTGQKFSLEFVYGGEVLADVGPGLLYVGERGTWYPNRGLEMANFDLQFTYPAGWTLVATGKPASIAPVAASTTDPQTSRWVSERPIPIAGFNLGKYKEVTAQAGSVKVETYATRGVERDFPTAPVQIVQAKPLDPRGVEPQVILPSRPSPTQTELAVAESAAQAIQYFAERFGPFPYSQLSLTQIPGRESQGWPSLIFLSSYVFLAARSCRSATDQRSAQIRHIVGWPPGHRPRSTPGILQLAESPASRSLQRLRLRPGELSPPDLSRSSLRRFVRSYSWPAPTTLAHKQIDCHNSIQPGEVSQWLRINTLRAR